MFSVVIPLYNKAHTIIRTLSTVITQTFPEFEIIIVNDGSTDEGVKIITSNFNDSRIRIINQANQGVSAARNKGVEEANFNYIAFLDADDEWLPGYLEKVKEAITLYPKSGLFCTPGLHRSILTGEGRFLLVEEYKNKIQPVRYFKDPKIIGGQTSGVVISKDIYNLAKSTFDEGGFPIGLNLNEDWTCFQSIAFITQSIYIGYSLTIRNIDIEGQLVALEDNGLDMRLNKSPRYLNITCKNYMVSQIYNNDFITYRKYELRSFIFYFIREHNIEIMRQFINKLENPCLELLTKFEVFLYRKVNVRFIIISYLILTKLIHKFNKLFNMKLI